MIRKRVLHKYPDETEKHKSGDPRKKKTVKTKLQVSCDRRLWTSLTLYVTLLQDWSTFSQGLQHGTASADALCRNMRVSVSHALWLWCDCVKVFQLLRDSVTFQQILSLMRFFSRTARRVRVSGYWACCEIFYREVQDVNQFVMSALHSTDLPELLLPAHVCLKTYLLCVKIFLYLKKKNDFKS